MTSYHRRSRDGCITCKSLRIKCDEEKPFCGKCAERGVQCQGFARSLKWVNVKDVPQIHGSSKAGSPNLTFAGPTDNKSSGAVLSHHYFPHDELSLPSPVHMSLKLQQPELDSMADHALFQYWRTSMFELSFPSPQKCDEYYHEKLMMATESNSILLPAILASASAHMAAAGSIPATEMLRRKDKAIKGLIRYISQRGTNGTQELRIKGKVLAATTSAAVMGMAVCASLHLIGTEITHGSEMKTFLALVRGAVSLVESWWTCQSLANPRSCPIVQLDIKLLAWHDLIGCIPYPRKPLLDKRYWYDECHIDQNIGRGDPDIVFGFTTQIALLTGECGALVNHFYSGQIDALYFEKARRVLLRDLSLAMENLPNFILMSGIIHHNSNTTASNEYLNYNACIWAAVAHALASQIYIYRAMNCTASAEIAAEIVPELERAICQVPCSSSAITIMLWPLWVLGCESTTDQTRQEIVVRTLKSMFMKNKFMNINQCQTMLETRIWKRLPENKEEKYDQRNMDNQITEWSSWVTQCYQENIQVILV